MIVRLDADGAHEACQLKDLDVGDVYYTDDAAGGGEGAGPWMVAESAPYRRPSASNPERMVWGIQSRFATAEDAFAVYGEVLSDGADPFNPPPAD